MRLLSSLLLGVLIVLAFVSEWATVRAFLPVVGLACLAFNVAMDLEPFHRINPCGYQGLQVTSVVDLGGPSGMEAVKPVLLDHLARQFGLLLQHAPELPDLSATA